MGFNSDADAFNDANTNAVTVADFDSDPILISVSVSEPERQQNDCYTRIFSFQPSVITISKGDSITWINQEAAAHTVVGSGFTSGVLQNGQSITQTFNDAGTFTYHCSIHPSMMGEIIVN